MSERALLDAEMRRPRTLLPGKSASLHKHLTQGVFVAPPGRWEIFWGPQGQTSAFLKPWGTVSVLPGVSRGFRNVSTAPAYLIVMASGRDPAMINGPAQVRAAALTVGVVLP